jgi:4-amino-4-deoxy-L-arabinose transferase-like glycosyltransferase
MIDRSVRSPLEWLLVIIILLASALLRFHDLGNIPKGLEHDEVATWHMVDRVLKGDLVIYFEEGYGHEPLFNYLTALPVAVWGHNWLGLRFWSPWLGLLAVAATYALMRRLFGPLVGIGAAAFQGTVLWALFFNRLGLRLNQLPFLLCVAVYCFWRGAEPAFDAAEPRANSSGLGAQLAWFAASGAAAGLCFYTYMSARVVPLFFGAFLLYAFLRTACLERQGWRRAWRAWWPAILFFAVAAIVMVPLALYLLNRSGLTDVPQREAQVDQPLRALLSGNPQPVLRNAWALVRMWNFDGERYWQLNYSHRPVFVEPISGLLFWVGLVVIVWRWQEPQMALLLLWCGLGMVPSLITSEAPSWPRTMLASPAALAFPGIAVQVVMLGLDSQRARSRWGLGTIRAAKATGLLMLGFSVVVTFVLTCRDFLIVWPKHPRVRFAFQSSLTEALRYLDSSPAATPVVMAGLSPHDMDPWTEASTLDRRDLSIRWVDTRSALLLPNESPARLIVLDITPIDPALASWAGLAASPVIAQGDIVPRGGAESDVGAPVIYDPAYVVQQLDRETLQGQIDKLESDSFVGADVIAPISPETTPTFGGLVQLVGYEWLRTPRAGQVAQLITCWRVLGVGPKSSRYGESALRTFVHLLDEEEQFVTGVDLLGAAPNTWRQGDTLVQLHTFAWPAAGRYAVELGWYVPPMGPRLSIDGIDAPGERILLLPVEVVG